MLAGPWAQIQDKIAFPDNFGIVFHHNDGVLSVPQPPQDSGKAVIVPGVKAYTRLVQNIKGVSQR